jgi:EAL domain-containing protein (putative c-di-GMP-specific phosphodiesterase class I)
MSSARSCVLLADDDPHVAAAVADLLEQPGRTTIVCGDVEAAAIVAEHHPVTHLLCDVQFTGDFGFEGLHFIGRMRAVSPGCRIVLMTGSPTERLHAAALSMGAADLLAKPLDYARLQRALAAADDDDGEPYRIINFPSLDALIAGEGLATVFQPIVRVGRDATATFGFEALARVHGAGPCMLLDYARRRSRLADLNRAFLSHSVRAAASLPAESTLFFNVDPLCFDEPGLPEVLDAASRHSGVALSRMVLEVTERSSFQHPLRAAQVFDELRRQGVRFALDDHGSAYSHLEAVGFIQPSFFKVSHAFGSAFEQDRVKENIVRHVLSLARGFGCEAIVEGIESETTAVAARVAGVRLAQGFHFGRPQEAPFWSA